ncbi:unnamed protein product, partial [Heterosigma akashiwo]
MALEQKVQRVVRERLDWEKEAELSLAEGDFRSTYRMSKASFDILLRKLEPSLNGRWCGRWHKREITSACKLAATLRYLAGGSAIDIRRCFGISKRYFYKVVRKTVDAINALDDQDLNIFFPRDHAAQMKIADGFKRKSGHGVMSGCAGCVDGLLVQIRLPRSTETNAASKYFSGHYQMNGLNVQAMCDALLRFTWMSCKCPGSTSDSMAFLLSSLPMLLSCLSPGLYILGDAAYSCTDVLLTPYIGVLPPGSPEDSYNFYLSQLRIRIEMAFGLLTTKWRILRQPLEVPLNRAPKIIFACMKLHNFCINRTLVERPG